MTKTGYMCTIAFEHHLEEDRRPSKIYSSIEDLKRDHESWEECGIVAVDVELVCEVVPQNLRGLNGETTGL